MNASKLTLKLRFGSRVDGKKDEKIKLLFDGETMNSGPIRGQLPRRQNQHLKNYNNNISQHHHHHHQEGNYDCENNYQLTKCNGTNKNNNNNNKSVDKIKKIDTNNDEDQDGIISVEKRPKVNPIFLWVLQREQRIIEVRCEDYDKRNRIKLTKTARGWKSIPRTSSNVYSSCCCIGADHHHHHHDHQSYLRKDSLSSSTSSLLSPQSVSSTCAPCSISSAQIIESSASSSELNSSISERLSPSCMNNKRVTRNKQILLDNKNKLMNKRRHRRRKKRRKQRDGGDDRLRYDDMSGDDLESDYQSRNNSFCRKSIDLSSEYDPNTVNYDDNNENNNNISSNNNNNKNDKYDEYEFHDTEDENNIINYEKRPFRLIDLEKAKNDQLLQPRVVLEQLNPSRIRLYSSASDHHFKLDDDIEMITESDNEHDQIINNQNNKQIVDESTSNCSYQHHIEGDDDDDDDDEEIEEIDDVEELEEDNPTVFEYDDRDSVDMNDDNVDDQPSIDNSNHNVMKINSKEDCISLLSEKKLTKKHYYLNDKKTIGDKEIFLNENLIAEEDIEKSKYFERIDTHEKLVEDDCEDVTIVKEKLVPDLKPIKQQNSHQSGKTNSNRTTVSSPPCSVTCSEDTTHRNLNSININPECKKAESPPNKRRREAPDLIEVKPTEWRRCELMRPSNQLKELIETSGGLIPDPLLVPRDRLAILAACPGIEIPRLLITRPELRLPTALSNPKLLSDPNILVISLCHLHQVLESAELKSRQDKVKPIDKLNLSNTIATNGCNNLDINSEKKRLSCKPIGSLMPAPIDLSKNSVNNNININSNNSILRVKSGLYKQEAEVTSTGDDSRLWHPLFSSRDRNDKRTRLQTHDRNILNQYSQNYHQDLQLHQDNNNHHSWHRTTLAS